MKKRATRLWGWRQRHSRWSSVMLMVLLVGMGVALYWTVCLVRFGLPPPPGQNCGSILHSQYRNQTARIDADLQSLQCFWQAYQTCQPATISQTHAVIDAGETDTVTIERRWLGCALYGRTGVFNWGTKSETFLCTQLSKKGETLQVSGCDGVTPFVMVPRDMISDAFPCGVVGSPSTVDTPQGIEKCLFAVYQQCLAGSMGYQTAINGALVERDFYIDTHCGIVYKHRSYEASCASLEMRADGLHFLQCGTDGDLFVPSAPQ